MSARSDRTPKGRTLLRADEARAVLLLAAFEEADGNGTLLSPGERQQATRAVRAGLVQRAETVGPEVEREDARAASDGGAPFDEGAFLVARARRLLPALEGRTPFELRPWLEGLPGPHPAWILVPALVLGLCTNVLGPSHHINVLAVPLLGLLAWNLAVYLFIAVSAVRSLAPERRRANAARTNGLLARLTTGYLGRAWRKRKRGGSKDTIISADATGRFLANWSRCALPIHVARLTGVLHLGAAAMAIGAITGMYQRGLLSRYMATWESTFLAPETADRVLAFLLAPARLLFGLELPSVERFTAPEVWPAADWIHAWALTAGLVIVAPRLALYARERWRLRRLEERVELPLEGEYYRALLSPERGSRSFVRVLPYSYTPAPRRADTLRALLHDAFGARAEVRIEERLDYGAEHDELPAPPPGELGRTRISWVLFALAQSPEVEVHGDFLMQLGNALEPGESLGVLIDGSSFAERLHELPEAERRMEERRRAWDRVVREARLRALHLDLDQLPPQELAGELPRALFPDGQTVEVAS